MNKVIKYIIEMGFGRMFIEEINPEKSEEDKMRELILCAATEGYKARLAIAEMTSA